MWIPNTKLILLLNDNNVIFIVRERYDDEYPRTYELYLSRLTCYRFEFMYKDSKYGYYKRMKDDSSR